MRGRDGAGRHEAGTSVLEVLIATMVLGVVALVVFTAFGIGLRAAALAGSMSTATGLAEEALARLAASPCGSSFGREAAAAGSARYHREVSARPADGAGLWELTATVSWTQERRERSVTLTTLRHVSGACEMMGSRG